MGQWWVDGKRESRCLGLIKDMTKTQAREEVSRIVAELQARNLGNKSLKFGDFVE
jgi:hypothetical protein